VKQHFALAAVSPEGGSGGRPAKRVAAVLKQLLRQGLIEEFGDTDFAAAPEGGSEAVAAAPGGRSSNSTDHKDGGGSSRSGGSQQKKPAGGQRRYVRTIGNVWVAAVERELAAFKGETQAQAAAGAE
jgi:hypothetical protein